MTFNHAGMATIHKSVKTIGSNIRETNFSLTTLQPTHLLTAQENEYVAEAAKRGILFTPRLNIMGHPNPFTENYKFKEFVGTPMFNKMNEIANCGIGNPRGQIHSNNIGAIQQMFDESKSSYAEIESTAKQNQADLINLIKSEKSRNTQPPRPITPQRLVLGSCFPAAATQLLPN